MAFPANALLKDLEVTHSEYQYYRDVWMTIQELREGAATLSKIASKYLPKRPDEPDDIYALRLNKFSYTPIMATAIREFVAKLASAPVHVASDSKADAFWSSFRENTDGRNQDEAELLIHIFSTLLYFGRCHLAVDLPEIESYPRSLAEQDPKSHPYITLFEPLHVTQWGADWYMTRQIQSIQEPLQPSRQVARWTYWTPEEVAVYECEVETSTTYEDGTLISRVKTGEEGWMNARTVNITTVPLVKLIRHGYGKAPMVALRLKEELWTGNSVYLKQIQHLRVESSLTDAGTLAGVVQRLYTPTPPTPSTDPLKVFQEPDYSDIKNSNAHILIGAGFEYVESEGKAIANLTSLMESIERQINDLVSMGYKTVASKSTLAQSGTSKEMDMTLLEDSMRTYGKKVAQLYQDALDMVGLAQGTGKATVVGLDTYSVSNLAEMVDTTVKLLPLFAQLPPTATQAWVSKLCSLMTGTLSPDQDKQLKKELEGLDLAVQHSTDPSSDKDSND